MRISQVGDQYVFLLLFGSQELKAYQPTAPRVGFGKEVEVSSEKIYVLIDCKSTEKEPIVRQTGFFNQDWF